MKTTLNQLDKIFVTHLANNNGAPPVYFLAGIEAKKKMNEEFSQLVSVPPRTTSNIVTTFRGITILEVLPPYPVDRIEAVG